MSLCNICAGGRPHGLLFDGSGLLSRGACNKNEKLEFIKPVRTV